MNICNTSSRKSNKWEMYAISTVQLSYVYFFFFFFKEKLAVLLQSALSGTCWKSGLPREAFMFPNSRALLFRNLTSAKTHAVNSIKVSDHLLIYAAFQPAKFVSIINAFTPASCLPF